MLEHCKTLKGGVTEMGPATLKPLSPDDRTCVNKGCVGGGGQINTWGKGHGGICTCGGRGFMRCRPSATKTAELKS